MQVRLASPRCAPAARVRESPRRRPPPKGRRAPPRPRARSAPRRESGSSRVRFPRSRNGSAARFLRRGRPQSGRATRPVPRSVLISGLRSAARHRTRLLRPGPVGNRQRPARKEQEQRDRCGEDSHGGLPRIVSASRRGRFPRPSPPVRPPGALVESASAMDPGSSVGRVPAALFAVAVAAAAAAAAADWPEGRGPTRDGRSPETALPESWSPAGENLLFKVPYGGRSTPVVLGDRLFLQNGFGSGATRQERLMALDAGTGALLWEQRRNLYHSDAPPRRVGWASPAVDAETGTVFSFTVGGGLTAFDAEDGSVRWERSLPEELGLISTHGGPDRFAAGPRRPGDPERPDFFLGRTGAGQPALFSASTSAPARSSGSRPRAAAPSTPPTPRPPCSGSAAGGCCWSAGATAPSTRSSRPRALRSGTTR